MIVVLQTLVFFKESLLAALDRILQPYYKHFPLPFNSNSNVSEDDDSEDQVFAEFDEEKGVTFFPPVYAQRYAAVSDCVMDERWCGKIEKVVDFGYHDMSFIKYLKEVPGIKSILGVDLETMPLRCSSDLLGCDDFIPKRETPLCVFLYKGNAADPDYRLIGCDAVVAIEMIEHMLPHDLERFVHTIFGFIKPWIAVITTPNGDFNPLFKALEKNGLRRLDHFFEWSREQFHDWCSNIVTRYPNYTVSCRGVGPGPPGTIHYGSCSQLALFVAKDYHKQQDLNLNSLAMVAKAPPNDVCDLLETLDAPDILNESNMLCPPNNMESYTELVFSNKQSCVTIVLSPTFSFEPLEYHDKTSQCNLDKEIGKNFLMFDEEHCCNVVVPRRKVNNRVYVIEDVNCRLNCTTLQVKRFSKRTQNMLSKNKIESLARTREVVDEIKHLTKRLNFGNEFRDPTEGDHVWHNINWGDNAPYWNQYYKLVKEYNYPFETKSEECRIIDLISEEINSLVDTQYDEDFTMNTNKLEIPIDHLMRVVQHITDDVDRVKDLLEWNGYEVSGDVVVHSRLVVDTASAGSRDDWRDNDTFTDWDTEVRSTSLSDGSTVVPDCHGRILYQALDQKVRRLRSMVSNNEDITTELDKVTCRLMKLAMRTTRRSQRPLTNRWMQCKLLDLLTLTEKAMEKKRQLTAEANQLKAICYEDAQLKPEGVLSKIMEDDTANKIVNKYRHLVRSSEKTNTSEDNLNRYFEILEDEFAKKILLENESSEFDYLDHVRSPSIIDIEPITAIPAYALKQYFNSNESLDPVLERTKAWVDEDVTIVEFSQNSALRISSGDTDHSVVNIARYKNKKNNKKRKKLSESRVVDIDLKHSKNHQIKTSHEKRNKSKNDVTHKHKNKTSTTRLIKKSVKKKSSYNILIKTCSNNISTANFGSYVLKAKKSIKRHTLHTSNSRPISAILMELCNQEKSIDRKDCDITVEDIITDSIAVSDNIDYVNTSLAITKESLLIDIIMDDKEETIALRRTIGTDAEKESLTFEQENILGSMTNMMKLDSISNKPDLGSENVQSQNLFIFDINEPSTSKGVRHVSMDVQCGPDTTNKYAMLSATTSFTKMPRMFNTGIRIGNSTSDMQESIKNCDFSTSTNENSDTYKTITSRDRFVGIIIKDSETTIAEKSECETMTQAMKTTHIVPSNPNSLNSTETKMLQPISSCLKMEDLESCESLESCRKSLSHFIDLSKDTSELQMELSISKNVAIARNLSSKYVRPKLVNGGVYVHSYKDRRVSEDVVYQGEWQKYSPSTAKKGRSNAMVFKKVCDGANKKVRASSKENVNTSKVVKSKPIRRAATCNLKDVKQERDKRPEIEPIKIIPIPNNLKATKNYRNPDKVASKLAAKSMPSKSNNKTSYVTKKPSGTFSIGKKGNESVSRPRKKSYIPLYLQRKLSKNNHHIISLESDPERKVTVENEKSVNNKVVDVVVTAKDIKGSLLKFDCNPRENLSYIVFRNEIEANNNSSTDCENPININSGYDTRADDSNRSLSPLSLNSSSGSSPHSSIATVRLRTTPKSISDRRHSTSSNKSNLVNRQTENYSLISKKTPKRCKSAKRAQDKVFDNKENLPETSRRSKDSGKSNKSSFLKNKNIFRAQIATVNSQSINNITKSKSQTPNKSNIKIPSIPSSPKKQPASETSSRPSLKKTRSLKSPTSSSLDNKSVKDSDNSDIVVTPSLEDQNITASPEIHENSVIINIVDHNLLTEWMSTTHSDLVESHTSSILIAMRELVEERLDFIEELTSSSAEVDTKMVVLNEHNDCMSLSQATSFHDATSLNSSYCTVTEINDFDYSQLMELGNSFFDSVLYNEIDPVLGNNSTTIGMVDNQPNITDLEQLSFKSMTSASKLSDYYLAESSLNILEALITDMPSSNPVQDIYERKTLLTMENPAGTLAVQAFSGFSMNGPIAEDQPDHVNLIDSETGSVALEYARQATSEEVFISGRSSDSYESCQIDDDTVVPNWLFQIISQQQSVQEEDEDEEEESEDLAPMQLPIVEPMFDLNGNVVEPGMGSGAGAGDGRGIHSDRSQDSSGRGTSLSSSATSSGPRSEAIIIDPTAFTAQYNLMREPLTSTSVMVPSVEAADTSHATAESAVNSRNAELLNSSGDPQRAPDPAASDVDADVSSIDTDVPDSSDN